MASRRDEDSGRTVLAPVRDETRAIETLTFISSFSYATGVEGVTGSLISESQDTRATRVKTNANIKRNFFISIHVHRAHRKEFS